MAEAGDFQKPTTPGARATKEEPPDFARRETFEGSRRRAAVAAAAAAAAAEYSLRGSGASSNAMLVTEADRKYESSADRLGAWPLAVVMRVRARFNATVLGAAVTAWFDATVTAVHHDDYSYDLKYDDGDSERRAKPRFVRPLGGQCDAITSSAQPAASASRRRRRLR